MKYALFLFFIQFPYKGVRSLNQISVLLATILITWSSILPPILRFPTLIALYHARSSGGGDKVGRQLLRANINIQKIRPLHIMIST